MKLQQFRFVLAAVEHGFNLTAAAAALHTSQSAASKQIQSLETELGFDIFRRKMKRLVGLTDAGTDVVHHIKRALMEVDNIREIGRTPAERDTGRFVIAATHNQATNSLPQAVTRFGRLFPHVSIELRQGTPETIIEAVNEGVADIGIATEAPDLHPELVTFPCFSWRHIAIAPAGHPLTALNRPTMADIVGYPIITYDAAFTRRSSIDSAMQAAGVTPMIRMTAMDADVIKTYVGLGLGIGILTEMALDRAGDPDIVILRHERDLFDPCFTKIAVRRGKRLRSFVYQFIELFAPHLDRHRIAGTVERGHPLNVLSQDIPAWEDWHKHAADEPSPVRTEL